MCLWTLHLMQRTILCVVYPKTSSWDSYPKWVQVSASVDLLATSNFNRTTTPFTGCFDLLLDAEKCKYGIEIQSTMGPDLMSGTGMFFGAGSTPSTLSPSRTPWLMSGTPQHVAWSPNNPGMCPPITASAMLLIVSNFVFLFFFRFSLFQRVE